MSLYTTELAAYLVEAQTKINSIASKISTGIDRGKSERALDKSADLGWKLKESMEVLQSENTLTEAQKRRIIDYFRAIGNLAQPL